MLRDAGFSPRTVLVDDGSESPNPLPGALRLRFDAGWTLVVEDYGMTEQLARYETFDDAAAALLAYLSGAGVPVEHLDQPGFDAALADQAQVMDGLKDAVRLSGVMRLDLPAGMVMDHLGAPDGLLLYLPDSAFVQRSLPLDAMDAERADLGRYYYRVRQPLPVQVSIVPPHFGQPGGALYFRLMPGATIRRLLAAGVLGRADVAN
jgi:nicrotizing toxin Mtb-like protein